MKTRLTLIREEEKKYHEACYDQYKLFEEGSWLYKPVKTVMEYLAIIEKNQNFTILDLGCGVGRNSIPMAETLLGSQGHVVCVDLLESALNKLMSYAEKNGVDGHLKPVASDIGDYDIPLDGFDYIVAVSSLEHVESEDVLMDVLRSMISGTKINGMNCIIINTNIQEMDKQTNEILEPFIEINVSTEQMEMLLHEEYKDWNILNTHVKQLEFTIVRNEREILLTSDCLTYVAQKSKSHCGGDMDESNE